MNPRLYEKLYGMRLRLGGGFILAVMAGLLVAALAHNDSSGGERPANPKPETAKTLSAVPVPPPATVHVLSPTPSTTPGGAPSPLPAANPVVEIKVAAHSYVVQRGDCIWRIAVNHCGGGLRWLEIYHTNRGKIRNPELIYPAQIFTIPCEQ
jgi:nucleoid-associated protein YgaU